MLGCAAMKPIQIAVKRIYEAPEPADGSRVLVDRLWPRGIRKEDAKLQCWAKELAPSTDLRKWFAHDPAKWDAFRQAYSKELKTNPATEQTIREILAHTRSGKLTLLFGTRDTEHNQAIVLKEYIERHFL